MALGGGTFVVQNKVLPGSYINFISAARASAGMSERGYAAMPIELDWGPAGEVFTVTQEDLQKNSLSIFGYEYTHEKMRGLRDLFKGAKTAHLYRLSSGTKASNEFASAKWPGIRGNELKTIITPSKSDAAAFDVITMIDEIQADKQVAKSTADLKDNDFICWKESALLKETAGTPFTGGTKTAGNTGAEYQEALDRLEPYAFQTLGCLSNSQEVKDLFVSFTKRMRDEVGVKFQTVLYKAKADYEGIISLENRTLDSTADESALVYWMTGAQAGCEINRDLTNRLYDGEFTPDTNYKQSALEQGIREGRLMLHNVGGQTRVLSDINTLITYTDKKGEDFTSNQTMRVLDQIGNDIAALFNTRFLGITPNDDDGRVSLWNAIVGHHRQLERLRAIEGFKPEFVKVERGDTKKSVVVTDTVTPVNAMQQLYMTIIVA